MTAPSPRVARATLLRISVTSALVAVATLTSFRALTVIIEPGPWTRTTTWFVLLLALMTVGTRLALVRGPEDRRRRHELTVRGVAPTLVGLLVGCWALLAAFGGPTSRGLDLAISGASLDRLLARLDAGRRLIAEEVAPLDASAPLTLIVVCGTVLVFLLTDLLVSGLRLPAAAALPLLALWVPPLVIEGSLPPAVFVITVVVLLLLVAVDNPHRPDRRPAAQSSPFTPTTRAVRAGGVLGVTSLIAVAALLAGTAAGAIPQVLRSPWSPFFTGAGPTVRLASDLDMEDDLRARSEEVALTYEIRQDGPARSGGIGPLRMFTLTGFDGRNWRRGDARQGPQVDAQRLLWPDDAASAGASEPRTIDVTLETLRDEQLALPTEPRTLDVDGEWFYDDGRDEVTGNTATEPGMAYSFTVLARDLTAEALRTSAGDDLDDPNALEVPDTDFQDEIRALAEEITADAPTRYDAAVALQSYFRDGKNFTYSTSVPDGETNDAVWNFLQDREGYCVQFATSMTMMARTLGIPARLGVGFLPGERTSDGVYQVTGKDSHAWPELYFPGAGWVRFEPTPAIQAGPVPSWADPLLGAPGSGQDAAPEDVPTNQAQPNAAPETTPSTAPAPGVGPGAVETEDSAGRGWVMGGIAAGVVLVLAALAWVFARRRTPVVREPDVESTWSDLVHELAALGIRWPESTTLRAIPATVASQVTERTGRPLPESSGDALVTLTSTVEAERYARTWSPVAPHELATLRAAVVEGVRDELSDRPARADGPTALPVGE
ncbi:transglutaminase family protein [Oerskovia turbata]